jgi:hypothetical protein
VATASSAPLMYSSGGSSAVAGRDPLVNVGSSTSMLRVEGPAMGLSGSTSIAVLSRGLVSSGL